MAERIAYLEAVVGADISSFRHGMSDVRGDLGQLSNVFSGMQRMGRDLTYAVTAPLIALGTGAVGLAANFEEAMRNVASISTDVAGNFADMSARVLEFGSSVRAGPQAAAESLYTVVSAGVLDMNEAFEIMSVSVHVAEANLADLQGTTQGVVSALLAFGQGADQAAHFGDVLTRTVQLGVGTLDMFNTAFGRVNPTAASLGVTFDELGGAMAYLTQRGQTTYNAGTALNALMNRMMRPTEALSGLFRELGVASGAELIQNMGGLTGAMEALYRAADGDATALNQAINSAQGWRAAAAIFNDLPTYTGFMEDFQASIEGATDIAWQQQMQSFAAQFDLLKSALSGLAITIGNVLLPVLIPIVQGITSFAQHLADAEPTTLRLGIALAALAAAAGPVLWIVGSLLSPIGLLVSGFVLFTRAVEDNVLKLGNLASGLEPVVKAVGNFVDIIFGSDVPVNDLADSVKNLSDTLPQITFSSDDMTLWEAWNTSDFAAGLQEAFGGNYQAFLDDALAQAGVTDAHLISSGVEFAFGQVTPPDASTLEGVLNSPEVLDRIAETQANDYANSLRGRFERAMAEALPAIGTTLSSFWNNVGDWITGVAFPTLDSVGGDLLATIAGWFQPTAGGGNTPVYQAIQNLFELDIAGAINALLPGVGDDITSGVASWGDSISEAFPTLIKGAQTLFSNIGGWITSEGLPTLARAFGFAIGRLGGYVGEGLGNLWDSITGIFSGGDGTEVAQAGKETGEAAQSPFVAGLQEGLAAGGVNMGNPIETLMTTLAGAIAVGAGVTMLGSYLMGAGFTGAIASSLRFAFRVSGLSSAVNFIAGQTTTQMGNAMVGQAGSSASRGVLIPMLRTFMQVALPVAEAALIIREYFTNDEFRNLLVGLGETIFGEENYAYLQQEAERAGTWLVHAFADTLNWMADGGIVAEAWNHVLEPITGAVVDAIDFVTPDASFATGTGLLDSDEWSQRSTTEYQYAEQMGQVSQPVIQPILGNMEPLLNELDAFWQLADSMAYLTVNPDSVDEMQTAVMDVIGEIAISVTPGTSLDVMQAQIIDQFSQLYVDFGVAPDIETARALVQTMLNGISVPVQVTANTSAAQDAINRLNGQTVRINVEGSTVGLQQNIGHHAVGGSALGPTWVGETGTELFIPGAAGTIIPPSMLDQMGGAGGSITTVSNHISINGVQDVDRMLYELRRRGIDLEAGRYGRSSY